MITHKARHLNNRDGMNIYGEVVPHRIPSGHAEVDALAELIPKEGTAWYCDRQALYLWGKRFALLHVGHGVYTNDFMKMDNYYRIDIVDPDNGRPPEWSYFCLPWNLMPVRKQDVSPHGDHRMHTLNLMAVAIAMLAEFPADGEVQLLLKKTGEYRRGEQEWTGP